MNVKSKSWDYDRFDLRLNFKQPVKVDINYIIMTYYPWCAKVDSDDMFDVILELDVEAGHGMGWTRSKFILELDVEAGHGMGTSMGWTRSK